MIIKWLIVRTHATLFRSTDKGDSDIVTAAVHKLQCKKVKNIKGKRYYSLKDDIVIQKWLLIILSEIWYLNAHVYMFNLFYRYDVDSASRNLKDHVSTKFYFLGTLCKVCGLCTCTCNIHEIIHTYKTVISTLP